MRRTLFGLICLLAGTGSAFPAGSDRSPEIINQFHKYFGGPGSGPDFIEVKPEGDSYRLTLLPKRLLERFHLPEGLSVDVADYALRLTPLADGTWRVDDPQIEGPFAIDVGETAISYRWTGLRFEGVFDPSLFLFSQLDESVDSIDSSLTDPTREESSHMERVTVTGSSKSDGEGAADATGRETVGALVAHMSVPNSDPSSPPFEINYGADSVAADVALDSVESPKLAALLAYVVAHLQEPDAQPDNEEIRRMLSDLLPIFERIEERGDLKGLHVETPFGAFGIDDLTGSLAVTGLVPKGDSALR